jgi:hypothetical protein
MVIASRASEWLQYGHSDRVDVQNQESAISDLGEQLTAVILHYFLAKSNKRLSRYSQPGPGNLVKAFRRIFH